MTRYLPTYMQEGSYPAQFDRLFIQDLVRTGPFLLSGAGAYLVSQHAGTPGMSVDVQPGRIAVPGTDAPNQGTYICWSDAVENPPVTASPPAGQSRIDLVVVQVRDDNVIGGGNNDFLVTCITGTPASTGSQAAPPLPHSAVLLAQILVGPNAASILNAAITDARPTIVPVAQPAGLTQMWLGDSTQPPGGWTVGDGRALSRTGIGVNLFAMWGTRFGVGDGSTTFNVPDLRGLLPIFSGGTIGIAMGNKGGAQTATLGSGNIPQMSAGVAFAGHTHSFPSTNVLTGVAAGVGGSGLAAGNTVTGIVGLVTSGASGLSGTVTIGSASPAAFSIVPPVIAFVPLIKL